MSVVCVVTLHIGSVKLTSQIWRSSGCPHRVFLLTLQWASLCKVGEVIFEHHLRTFGPPPREQVSEAFSEGGTVGVFLRGIVQLVTPIIF